MIELILLFLTLIFVILSAGLFLSKFLLINLNHSLELHELGFIGIFFYTFLSIFIHLFLPLNEIVNSIIFIFLFLYFFLNYYKIFKKKLFLKQYYYFLIFLIVVFMTIKYKPNEDYGFYHLPYIVNLINEKVIFGLSNLQVQYAWNSSWLNFSSIMYLPFTNFKGTQLTNSILFFFILIFFFKEILSKKRSISQYFIVFFSFYVVIKFSRISEHGFDFPANFFLILSFFYLIKFFEANTQNDIIKNFIFLMFFSIFSITIKISTFVAPFLLIIIFLIILRKKIQIKLFFRPLMFCVFFLLAWLTQQFIYSSCLLPFYKFTCLEATSWFQTGLPEALNDATGAVNKSYNEYKGDLSKEEYLQNFNWVSTWFFRNKTELLEHLAALLVPIVILTLFNIKNIHYKMLKENKKFYKKETILILLFFSLFGLIIWFAKSPVIRFGISYLYVLFFIIVLFILINLINLKNINGLQIVFILCLIFNFSKNTLRIKNSDYKGHYFPKILQINYSNKNIDNQIINYPNPKIISSKSNLCWSIPFICHIGKGQNIKIEKKHSYFIIKNLNE